MDAQGEIDVSRLSDRDKQELQQFIVNETQKSKIQQCMSPSTSTVTLMFRHLQRQMNSRSTRRSPRASSMAHKPLPIPFSTGTTARTARTYTDKINSRPQPHRHLLDQMHHWRHQVQRPRQVRRVLRQELRRPFLGRQLSRYQAA